MDEKDSHKLKEEAVKIADYTCLMINFEASRLNVREPYKAHFILEEVIKILESKV